MTLIQRNGLSYLPEFWLGQREATRQSSLKAGMLPCVDRLKGYQMLDDLAIVKDASYSKLEAVQSFKLDGVKPLRGAGI